MRKMLFDALKLHEVELLAAVLVDRQTQREIASRLAIPRSTVESRVHVAAAKLARIGLNVPLPRRGRPRSGQIAVRLDPELIDRMDVQRDGDGVAHGRWLSSPKIARDSANASGE